MTSSQPCFDHASRFHEASMKVLRANLTMHTSMGETMQTSMGENGGKLCRLSGLDTREGPKPGQRIKLWIVSLPQSGIHFIFVGLETSLDRCFISSWSYKGWSVNTRTTV